MLQELRIRNFAIIDSLSVCFGPGLTVLTGETGAGKSIIVDALGLTLGERASADMIRAGQEETAVEADFSIPHHPQLQQLDIPAEDGVIIRRSISGTGKSRSYINDTMVNLQTLAALGSTLVDIHGQHEHQSLLSTDTQRAMVDAFGKLLPLRSEVETLYRETQKMRAELTGLQSAVREREQRIDLLTFQVKEIEAAALKEDELTALNEERKILANHAKLNELIDAAYQLLYSGDDSISEKLSSAAGLIREVSNIDQSITEVLELLQSAKPLIDEAAVSIRGYKDRYDIDPRRLEEVEDRIDLIRRLERKYGEGTESILRHKEDALTELSRLTSSDERLRELNEALATAEKRLSGLAADLSGRRKAVAEKIEAGVMALLKDLALDKAGFLVEVRPSVLSATGADEVQFLFSANKGEPAKPLNRAASGGELSRIMLALKGILAEVDQIPVLIFDEVDAGIGGRTAERVGKSLKGLARKHQVICITHLPQIAALADSHMMISKEQGREGVRVSIKELSDHEREEEIARMLGGKVTDISMRHARELLQKGTVSIRRG